MRTRGTGGSGSRGSLEITIKDNTGIGPSNYTGGGAWISIQQDARPTDVSACTHLIVEASISGTSHLANTKIKLEDDHKLPDGNPEPKPELILADFGEELTSQWQTYAIPLDDFSELKSGYPDYWRPVDPRRVTKITVVIVHDDVTSDGTLFVDNIRFARRNP